MKILIYGFKPYKKYKENVSEKVRRKLMTAQLSNLLFFDKIIIQGRK